MYMYVQFIAYCSSNHGNNTPESVHEGLLLQEYIANLMSDASTLEQMYMCVSLSTYMMYSTCL